MHWLPIGLALLLALAIIAIGAQYVASPTTAARSFGLPLPENGANIPWWLRLKGVRDIVAGLAVLAFMAWAPRAGSASSCLLKPSSPSATCCSFLQPKAP